MIHVCCQNDDLDLFVLLCFQVLVNREMPHLAVHRAVCLLIIRHFNKQIDRCSSMIYNVYVTLSQFISVKYSSSRYNSAKYILFFLFMCM